MSAEAVEVPVYAVRVATWTEGKGVTEGIHEEELVLSGRYAPDAVSQAVGLLKARGAVPMFEGFERWGSYQTPPELIGDTGRTRVTVLSLRGFPRYLAWAVWHRVMGGCLV